MSTESESSWKWWVSSFAIPLAMFAATAGTLFVAYLQYHKDVDAIRTAVRDEYATAITELKGGIAERDRIIEKQKADIERLSKTAVAPPVQPLPTFDYGKYIRPDAAADVPPPWTDQLLGFVQENWKVLAVLAAIVIAGAFAEAKKAR